ncbi:hypothetical protein T069G_09372 [Trichoderma breve]|uniref:Uncharacterized protein n=1 Tax=Trichoderma breve TaxID=2034170 RepID=A0A9W9B564_9HYPO|nr:hypothetical protein T069G_09372 [Trichoderma breve]KAJ4856004.1 hypothetical protein T069G_09372 [Trichoderma breve]
MALQSPPGACRPEKGKNALEPSSLRRYQSNAPPDAAFFRTGPPYSYWNKTRLHIAASPRKPQLFVTQVDITKLSHCYQSLQQQTPRPDHRPPPSVCRVNTLEARIITAIVISSLSTPSRSSIIILPSLKRISNLALG